MYCFKFVVKKKYRIEISVKLSVNLFLMVILLLKKKNNCIGNSKVIMVCKRCIFLMWLNCFLGESFLILKLCLRILIKLLVLIFIVNW